jgi:hypothetical protein
VKPEYLALCLERLSASAASNVHIYADSVSEKILGEMEIVRDQYLPEAFLFRAKPHVPAVSGSWNILNAIKHGAKFADEVFLVEEDVMIYPDFFQWHATQTADISCGRRIPRHPKFLLYTNPGSRFSRRALDAIIPHINDEYYADTDKYCAKFPAVHLSTLDDGLIRRIIVAEGLTVSFPSTPKCAHQGIPLLNRLDIYPVVGESIGERVESVRQILAGPKNADRYAPLWEPYLP